MTLLCGKCGSINRNASGRCRPCQAARTAAWNIANPDKRKAVQCAANKKHRSANPEKTKAQSRESNRKRYLEHPEKKKAADLKSKYGLNLDKFAELLAAQGGRCDICRTMEPGGRGGWKVDHKHVEGYKDLSPEEKRKLVRGLLCDSCNKMVSKHFEKYHDAGVKYLERHSDVK